MPRIYSDEKREEIKMHLLEVGLRTIRQSGLKRLSIEQLTKEVGIAQGTFYHFFASKERLVHELARVYQEKLDSRVAVILKERGRLEREDIRYLYHEMMLHDTDNVYRYLSREDIQIVATRLPAEFAKTISERKQEMEKNLTYVTGKKEEYDLDAILSWIQVMNFTIENQDLLVGGTLEKIIDSLIENMLNELFERKTGEE